METQTGLDSAKKAEHTFRKCLEGLRGNRTRDWSIPGQKKGNSNRMNWCIPPSLQEKATSSVQEVEEGQVLRGPEKGKAPNLKVWPEVAEVVVPQSVRQKCHTIVWRHHTLPQNTKWLSLERQLKQEFSSLFYCRFFLISHLLPLDRECKSSWPVSKCFST